MFINFSRVRSKALIPTIGHDDKSNAGIDFYACLDEVVIINEYGSAIIPTGVAWEPKKTIDEHNMESFFRSSLFHTGMIIQSRSGMAFKEGVEASNAGVIDEGYRGEIMIKLYNTNTYPVFIKHGQKIAQGVIVWLPYVEIQDVEFNKLSSSQRGHNGFGSSGQ